MARKLVQSRTRFRRRHLQEEKLPSRDRVNTLVYNGGTYGHGERSMFIAVASPKRIFGLLCATSVFFLVAYNLYVFNVAPLAHGMLLFILNLPALSALVLGVAASYSDLSDGKRSHGVFLSKLFVIALALSILESLQQVTTLDTARDFIYLVYAVARLALLVLIAGTVASSSGNRRLQDGISAFTLVVLLLAIASMRDFNLIGFVYLLIELLQLVILYWLAMLGWRSAR